MGCPQNTVKEELKHKKELRSQIRGSTTKEKKESPSNYEVFYVLLNVLTDFVPVKQLCSESKFLSLTKFVKTVLFDKGKIGRKIFCVLMLQDEQVFVFDESFLNVESKKNTHANEEITEPL